MPLTMRLTGLGSGIDKDRQDSCSLPAMKQHIWSIVVDMPPESLWPELAYKLPPKS
jgi:hypothetical protein